MPKPGCQTVAFLVFATCFVLVSGGNAHAQSSVEADKAALEALYDATDGANWTNNTGWKTSDPLGGWHGVTTNSDGRVTALSLDTNGLNGSLPSALGNLTELEELFVVFNTDLTGSIPAALGNLSNLEKLELFGNKLTGSIPGALGNLAKLTVLDVTDNDLDGSIPTWLEALTELESLYVGLNSRLSGSIPEQLGNLSKLERFGAAGTSVSGELPSALGNLSALTYLWLHENSLSGSIPDSLGNLTSLRQLHLNDNSLTGKIPTTFGNLTSLTRLELQNNELSEIPAELGSLAELVYLYLYSNDLTGVIPAQLGNLTKLRNVQLHDNADLTGVIPFDTRQAVLGNLAVSGTGLCAPPVLHAYWDANISYDGHPCTTPADDRTFLESFYDSTGGGSWVDGTNWKSVETLADWHGVTVRNGFVTGLELPGNGLTGTIPAALAELTLLETLDLSGNGLTGGIPDALRALTRLRHMDLSGNALTGEAPVWLGNLSVLEELDLSDNSDMTGPVPASITRATALRTLNVSGTTVCLPPDRDFQNWLDAGPRRLHRGSMRTHRPDGSGCGLLRDRRASLVSSNQLVECCTLGRLAGRSSRHRQPCRSPGPP